MFQEPELEHLPERTFVENLVTKHFFLQDWPRAWAALFPPSFDAGVPQLAKQTKHPFPEKRS